MPPSPPASPRSAPDPRSGVFQNGVWRCNCQPRLNARVRAITGNRDDHGRRFYGCPTDPRAGNRCDMFLFVEDAGARERKYLRTNGRSEKRQTKIYDAMAPRRGKGKGREKTPAAATAAAAADDEGAPTATLAETSKRAGGGGGGAPAIERPDSFYANTSDEDEDEDEKSRPAAAAAAPAPTPSCTLAKGTTPLLSAAAAATIRTPTTKARATSPKRKRATQDDDDDDFDGFSTGDEGELIAVTDRTSRDSGHTPGTLGRHRDAFATPADAARTFDAVGGLPPTPPLTKGKPVARGLFTNAEVFGNGGGGGGSSSSAIDPAKRQRLGNRGTPTPNTTTATTSTTTKAAAAAADESARLFGTAAVIDAPTTTTMTTTMTAVTSPPSPPQQQQQQQQPQQGDSSLTAEVMALLDGADGGSGNGGIVVSPGVRAEVRRALERHANLARGYERGRDAARGAAKEAEDRAARLQAQVADLERARQEMRTQLMDLWNKF